MHVIDARNVSEALPRGLHYLIYAGRLEASRAGDVIVAPGPVTTIYRKPMERVLLSPLRDANPFFHLAEAVWMLAGRDDAAFLNNYVRDFGERFAEPEGVIHGAYGHRWRRRFGLDQLDVIVSRLRADPGSRQCVLQMWDCSDDGGTHDLDGNWRDRPCNTHVYFRVQDYVSRAQHSTPRLDMLVSCRSNDVIWGAYGANAVHFAFLLEYVAARTGFRPGVYEQMSFNYHVYVRELERLKGKIMSGGRLADVVTALHHADPLPLPVPLARDPDWLDRDLYLLVCEMDRLHNLTDIPSGMAESVVGYTLRNTFLSHTVFRAAWVYKLWRLGQREQAHKLTGFIEAPDWGRACREWLERRLSNSQ